MVLILSLQQSEGNRKTDNKTERYQVGVFKGRLAVFYDSRQGPPEVEDVDAANQDISLDEAPSYPFFVTSFDGFMDGTKEELSPKTSEEPEVLEILMADISARVAERENVTIVNRGFNADKFLERILRSLQKSIEGSAENAMQIVADEIAKEKQMQRLLQLENEANLHVPREYNVVTEEEQKVREATGLSSKLTRSLRELKKKKFFLLASGKRAAERFTLLTAAHHGELVPPCTRGSCLTPEAFITMPPQRAPQNIVLPRGKLSSARNSYFSSRFQRRSTLSVLSGLEVIEDVVVEPIKGNGWGKEINYYVFNGENSVMALPGIPKFEDVVKGFTVDFWFKRNEAEKAEKRVFLHIMDGQRADIGQLFQISLRQYEEMGEAICIYVRDGTNRVLECLMPLRTHMNEAGGEETFHHFMLRVLSLEEGNLECYFDGQSVALQIVQQEYPILFNPWPHRLFIGGYLDESNTPTCVFCGAIIEVRFSVTTEKGFTPVVRWPLLVDGGKLKEVTLTIPPEHHDTLLNLEKQVDKPPRCAPSLDGNLVVNLGTLGVLGELMYNWRLEIRFRTDVNNRTMSLIGVTDRQCRMQEFGVVLNAEPVFGKERFRFHEYNITLYLVDAFGACCSALLRGSEHQNFMDGQWHTLVWKCIDSEANTYRVKVDGVVQELLYLVREGPRRFLPFVDWVCLGGHNTRNYKVRRPFYGEIARFFISVRGVPLATLNMDEGPGAYVLQDASGRHNHGLLINPLTNAVRRHDVLWFPHIEESLLEGTDVSGKDEFIIHKNNVVSMAAVVFTCDFNSAGVTREVAYDILGGTTLELDVVEKHISDNRPEWKTWRALPDSCFKQVESLVQLEEVINSTLSTKLPVGHFMFIIRIGDCYVTLLNLYGPVLPPDAKYNVDMLKWQYGYAISGTKGRRELLLNQMIQGVESILVSDTLTPFTTAKLGPLNSSGKSIVTEDIIRSLQNSGKPWYLSAVLHHHLLNAEFGSSLHIIHHFPERLSADEAASIALFNKRLYNGSKEKASIMIQRNWRARQARLQAMQLNAEKEIRERKVEEITALRLNPLVQAKKKLFALLITLHQIVSEAIPPISDDAHELAAVLVKQGYEVTHLPNPDRATLMKALSDIDEDASSFVYISGYGGTMGVHQPPLISLHSLHIMISEGAHRVAIEQEWGTTYRRIRKEFLEEYPQPKVKKGKRKNNAPPSKKALQEAEMAARHREEIFRMSVAEIEKDEENLRRAFSEEYDTEVLMIIREMKLAIEATMEYERVYKKDPLGVQFVLPCEAKLIEPYANTVYTVEELLHIALHRHMTPVGLQRVVALDLEPITPMSCGFACVASSTGYTLRFPYQPQQRRVITDYVRKAFEGRLPRIPANTRYAILKGGIETESNERDWRSFATYLVSRMQSICSKEAYAALREELDREVPFTAELIPVRNISLDSDVKDKLRREREAKEINIIMRYAVGSSQVQSDMFSVFRNVVTFGGPLKEILFKNTIYVVFTRNNKDIDGLVKEAIVKEVEKCRPSGCKLTLNFNVTAGGVRIVFNSTDSSDKMYITQWINGIVVRSLTWQLPVNPFFGYRTLDVGLVEYLYEVKSTCSLRKFRQLQKQQHEQPVPAPYIRFIGCEDLSSS
ncbi:uncharacterized protein TM35_000461640 [Trypanosoma theileri]|uniref:Uncharacterized protein n=1 Tax=Trypanosoma theileri TaxID=67003 RepID=A0A1X0NHY5_9TRYP|nr:uncharacterized protein TM35_000461640 [Trypanosoma theileri]ORC84345.1 hypothetical protein TM35_000461640 [Trypanosoma theileri]